jgi:hypothetical protein
MSAGKFSCDGCNKSYTWKPELAGRRVKCKCGHVMTVPNADPAAAMYEAPPEGFEDLYSLAEEKVVQAVPAYVKPQAVGAGAPVPASRGAVRNAAAAPTPAAKPARAPGGNKALLGYAQMASQRGGRAEEQAAGGNVFWNPVTDLYVPAALIVLGMFLSFFEIRWALGINSIPFAIGAVGVMTIINVVFGFAGILIAARLLDLGLGPIPVAVMKTAAASILPAAAASLVENLIGFGGNMLAWVISFTLSLVIFMKLMDMDYFETCVCAVIIWLIRTWVGYAILGLIFSGAGSKVGGALASAAGGGSALSATTGDEDEDGVGAPSAKATPAEKYDKRAQGLLHARRKPDAKAWVADPSHTFAKRTHDQSVKIVDDLTAMGASFMVVPDPTEGRGKNKGKEIGRSLVFVLPSDKDARRKIFDYHPSLGKTFGNKEPKDEGQQYMSIEFSNWFFDEDDENAPTPPGADEDDEE